MGHHTTDHNATPTADQTPYSHDEAGILARFRSRTLALPADVAGAATRGTFALI